jgi:hypothetical protein
VTVEDSANNPVTGDASTVTLSITTGTPTTGGPGAVTGCAQSESAGVITFTGCEIDTAGVSYELHATDGGLTPDDSAAFDVSAGAADHLVFSTSPGNSTAGEGLSPQPVITVEDANNNTVTTDSSTVTLAITSGTPTAGGPGTLSGCSQTATSGVVTFTGCSIDTPGTAYQLHATDGTLTAADSSAFDVIANTATHLVFTTSPANGTAGGLSPQPVVTVEDASGNPVATDLSTVALSILSGTPTAGGPGAVTGCSQSETAGVVTFSGCAIDTAGTAYQLHATDGTLTAADSSAFNLTVGPASQLAVTTQPPASSNPGASFAVGISVEDSLGNVITTDNATAVTLSIDNNPSGGVLSCTTNPVTVANGVASFSCSINNAGNGYTLDANSNPEYTVATTDAFNIASPAPPPGTLTQGPPFSATVAHGTAFSSQLTVTGASGTVTYTETSSADSSDVVVSSSGAISAAASLGVGTYTVSGTDADTSGDTGTWSFTLTVSPTPVTLIQGPPTSATVPQGIGFSGQLTVTNATGTVTWAETASTYSTDVVVSSSGAISASAALAPGIYTVSGTDADSNGDTGTWAFTLNVTPPGPQPPTTGYWLVASDGGIFSFGNAGFFGSTGNIHLNQPVVGMASTPDHQGYWMVASDGGIFAFGDAGFFGSMGGTHLNKPVVGMASTPDGKGYWLVASDGGIFAFGDAGFFGSTGNIHLNQPVVGMTSTSDGKGYWFDASDGGIFAFGDARFFGSMGGTHLNLPAVGMASTPDGGGYWLVAADGGIFAFGDAGFFGSTGNIHLNQPVVGMTSTADGQGYWFVASDGGIFAFGDAPFDGSMGGTHLNKPVVGMAST